MEKHRLAVVQARYTSALVKYRGSILASARSAIQHVEVVYIAEQPQCRRPIVVSIVSFGGSEQSVTIRKLGVRFDGDIPDHRTSVTQAWCGGSYARDQRNAPRQQVRYSGLIRPMPLASFCPAELEPCWAAAILLGVRVSFAGSLLSTLVFVVLRRRVPRLLVAANILLILTPLVPIAPVWIAEMRGPTPRFHGMAIIIIGLPFAAVLALGGVICFLGWAVKAVHRLVGRSPTKVDASGIERSQAVTRIFGPG